MTRSRRHLLQDPTMLVALVAIGQIVTWTLAPVLTHSSPPLDVVEGYVWGREWVLATYKHPALPSWALEASRVLTGSIGWPAYLLSEACVAVTFLCVYALGRDLLGAERAAAGTLLLTGIAFYAWPTVEFNHNLAAMPIWAALPLALWRALRKGAMWWWLLLGALAALGMYAKFSTALLLATMAAWVLWDQRARAHLGTIGPWLGLSAFAVLLAPLVYWLFANDFAPLRYAALRSAAGGGVHIFIINELLNLLGMAAMLWTAGLIGPRRGKGAPSPQQAAPIDANALSYLAVLTCGPLAIAILGALLSGANLRPAWASFMFNLAGLFAIALTAPRFDERALRRIAAFAAALIVLVPVGYALVVLYAPQRAGTHMRVNWPQAEMSRRLAGVWTHQTGAPLRIVGGDDWIAGLVGVSAPDRPSVLSGGDLARSPWISAERLKRQGMLIVWDANKERIPPALQPFVAAATPLKESFAWPDRRGGELTIGYVIVAPNSGVR